MKAILNKELVISLIQQDLKHCQLVSGLEGLGFDSGGIHSLEILEIVSKLMDVPKGRVSDEWGQVYHDFMEQAVHYKIVHRSESLRSLAESCYSKLFNLLEANRSCRK